MSAASKQHENFEISEVPRRKVIRQDRLDYEGKDCFVELGSTKFKVMNITAFGVGVFCEQRMDTTEFFDVPLVLHNTEVQKLHLKVARQSSNENGHLLGLEVLGEPISLERLDAVQACQVIINVCTEAYQMNERVPAEFRKRVLETKEWLGSLQKQINAIESSDSQFGLDYENTVMQLMAQYMTEAFPAKNDFIMSAIGTTNPEVIKDCFNYFRSKLEDLIYQSKFADRTFKKPLGYAGDYEMMNLIYRPREGGDSLFAKALNLYWTNQPAAQAVRNRADYLTRKLSETMETHKHDLKVLSVASGPAMEWQHMIGDVKKYNERKVHVQLLDQDENALKHAQMRMRKLSYDNPNSFKFEFVNKAIKNIIGRGVGEGGYDLIYSAGLFDYFSDPVAQIAAQRLFEALKPGGRLIIGNFNVTNPNSMMMDMALDWHLLYRSEEDLQRLFNQPKSKMHIEHEMLGINLFCVVEKL